MTPLHTIGEALRGLLLAVPLPAVRVLFLVTLAVLLIWVWRLPRSRTTPPSGARRWDENLKLGASIALILQIIVYCIF